MGQSVAPRTGHEHRLPTPPRPVSCSVAFRPGRRGGSQRGAVTGRGRRRGIGKTQTAANASLVLAFPTHGSSRSRHPHSDPGTCTCFPGRPPREPQAGPKFILSQEVEASALLCPSPGFQHLLASLAPWLVQAPPRPCLGHHVSVPSSFPKDPRHGAEGRPFPARDFVLTDCLCEYPISQNGQPGLPGAVKFKGTQLSPQKWCYHYPHVG